MRSDDYIRVLHMVEAIETALAFVSGRKAADPGTDRMPLFALMRAIEMIGEAAGSVSELCAQVPPIYHGD
jgi:uncharacterized protein with HEPN domain